MIAFLGRWHHLIGQAQRLSECPDPTQGNGQNWDSGLRLCVSQVHVLSLVALTPETACFVKFLGGG